LAIPYVKCAMTLSIKTKQISLFFLLLLSTAILCLWGYGLANPEYVAFRHAEEWRAQGDMGQAARDYQRAIDLGLRRSDAFLHLSEAYLKQGRAAEAQKILANLLEEEQSRATAMLAAGLYDAYGLPDQALNLVVEARKRGPLQETEMAYLANLHRRGGRYAEALAVYREMRKAHPASLSAALGLAETLAWGGRLAEAMCREILLARPGHRNTRILLARVLSWDGRREEAILEYQTVLGERP
jgi:tetratricopeptide (TPR) repeat protein